VRRYTSLLVAIAVVLVIGEDIPVAALAAAPSPASLFTVLAPHRASPKARAAKKPGAARTVALTFDDGPSRYTGQILDILKRNHVHATFCMLGDNAGRYRANARRVVAEGHRVCNHSRDHKNMTKLTSAKARAEVTQAQGQIRAAAGVTPKVFRFPYGASNARVRAVVRGTGLRSLGWNVDTRDWQRPPARTITARAVGHSHPGAVILMHDGGGDRTHTIASLDATIKQLRHKGYTFVLA
jgi:peptidoglycan/xylan/chitin deacetylase (PgdA/CDA1 family)